MTYVRTHTGEANVSVKIVSPAATMAPFSRARVRMTPSDGATRSLSSKRRSAWTNVASAAASCALPASMSSWRGPISASRKACSA